MKMNIKHPYSVTIRWSEEDEAYVARVPAIDGVISHGDTIEEAAANIQEALEGALESMTVHGDPIPPSDLATAELRRYAPILNTSALARKSGLNKSTLASKIRRGTPFSESESKAIQVALDL